MVVVTYVVWVLRSDWGSFFFLQCAPLAFPLLFLMWGGQVRMDAMWRPMWPHVAPWRCRLVTFACNARGWFDAKR